MNLSILLAFVAVATVSSYDSSVHSVVYKPGEEYVYHYKGQVLSGIPKASMQFAGLLLDTRVVLQFQHDEKVIMKLDNIKLFKVNNKISTLPSEPLSESDMTHLTGEQAEVLKQYLLKPLKFRYVEGEVREIEKETRDRFWSVNIKKGILSLFQVTLKDKRMQTDSLLSSDPMKSHLRSLSSNSNPLLPGWKLSKINTSHKTMEADVTGVCETAYVIVHDTSRSVSTMHVTAARNFDNCLSRPFYVEGVFQGVYRYDAEKELIQPLVHVDYVITGDRTHFLIKDAVLRGKYFFMPTGLEGGDMSSYIYQKLTLERTTPITTPFHLKDPKPETRGLLMVIPKANILPESSRSLRSSDDDQNRESSSSSSDDSQVEQELLSKKSERRIKREESEDSNGDDDVNELSERSSRNRNGVTIISVVKSKLNDMVNCLYPATTDKKCATYLYHVTRILRDVTKKDLKPLLVRYLKGNGETDYRKSQILLDILPSLPSPDAGLVLVELIHEKHITEFRGFVLLKRMSLVVKPTPMLIKAVLELYKSLPKERKTTVSSRTLLRQASLLAVGTLTHRLITVMRSYEKPVPEVISFLDTISSEMKQLLIASTDDLEKILVLKSMGNMGTNELIPTLVRILEDQHLTLKVRVSAVFALRRLCKQYKNTIVPVMLGVLMNVKEVYEVRQAAFVVIINCNPSYVTLQLIAHLLRNEPSSQMRTMIYSNLVNLALFSPLEPEHKELKKNARLVIKTIPAVAIGVHDTMTLQLSKFSEEFDFGGSLKLTKTKSKSSGLPEALIANIQGTLLGKHRSLFEAGVEGKGLETILRKIFGPHGLFKDILSGKVSLLEFLKPLVPDMGGIELKIKELLRKATIELQREENPIVSWYCHVLGNELQYVILDAENVIDAGHRFNIFVEEWLTKLSRGVKVDIVKSITHISSLTIASPVGIPLHLNFTSMSIFKVDGHVKVNNMPTWSQVARFPVTFPKMTVEIDLKPTVDMSHFLHLGADMRWLTTSVGVDWHVQTTVPVKLDIHLDRPEHTFSVKNYLPKKTVRFHSVIEPVTTIKYFPTSIDKLPFIVESKEITNSEIIKVVPVEYKYTCGVTSVEIEARGQYCVCGPIYCPTVPLFGKAEITIVAHPTSHDEFVLFKIKSLKTNFDLEAIPASRISKELYESDSESQDDDSSEKRVPRIPHRPRTTESDDFDEVTPDSIFTDVPMKRQILITFGTPSRDTPTIRTLVTWLMGRRYLKQQLNVQFVRPSTGRYPLLKLHLNKVLNLAALHPDLAYEASKGELIFKSHVFWTAYGTEQDIKVKILAGSSIDILGELKQQGIITADNLPKAVAQKYKYTLESEFKHMSKRTLRYITIVQNFIQNQFYDYLTIDLPEEADMKKIIIAVEIMPKWELMNVVMKTPREISFFTDVPFYWSPFVVTNQKIRMHSLPSSSFYRNSSRNDYLDTVPYGRGSMLRDECLVNHREHEVNTFDGATLPINREVSNNNQKACWMIMAQDCNQDGLFTIVSKAIRDGRIFKLLVPKYEIELKVQGEEVVVARINDEEKVLQVSRPILIKNEREESSATLYKIEKLRTTLVEVKAYELGITMIVDIEKRTSRIKVSPLSMLQGQLCGLCGNNNQDQSDEFEVNYEQTQKMDEVEERDEIRRPFRSLARRHRFQSVIPSETCDIDINRD